VIPEDICLMKVDTRRTDRDGHNWIVHTDDSGQPHLRLTDHGYAFGAPGRALASTFYRQHQGLELDDQIKGALQRLMDSQFKDELGRLLPDHLVDDLLRRVQGLLDHGRLP